MHSTRRCHLTLYHELALPKNIQHTFKMSCDFDHRLRQKPTNYGIKTSNSQPAVNKLFFWSILQRITYDIDFCHQSKVQQSWQTYLYRTDIHTAWISVCASGITNISPGTEQSDWLQVLVPIIFSPHGDFIMSHTLTVPDDQSGPSQPRSWIRYAINYRWITYQKIISTELTTSVWMKW